MKVKSYELGNLKVIVNKEDDIYSVEKYVNNQLAIIVSNVDYHYASAMFDFWASNRGN